MTVSSFWLAALLGPPLAAQEAPILTLDDALRLFGTNNLEFRLARTRAAEAAGLADQARAFPNPSVTATYEPLSGRAGSNSESTLTISQRLELPASGAHARRSPNEGARRRSLDFARIACG
jgi:hypothetical protein